MFEWADVFFLSVGDSIGGEILHAFSQGHVFSTTGASRYLGASIHRVRRETLPKFNHVHFKRIEDKPFRGITYPINPKSYPGEISSAKGALRELGWLESGVQRSVIVIEIDLIKKCSLRDLENTDRELRDMMRRFQFDLNTRYIAEGTFPMTALVHSHVQVYTRYVGGDLVPVTYSDHGHAHSTSRNLDSMLCALSSTVRL